MTNADRASRAETAVAAYIEALGTQRFDVNGIETWAQDLITDLHHLLERMNAPVRLDLSWDNYLSERAEDEEGDFAPAYDWIVEFPMKVEA